MNKSQKKLIEIWLVLVGLFVVVGIFQDNVVIARSAFIPVVIYFYKNYQTIRAFEKKVPTVRDMIYNSKFLSLFGIVYLALAIAVSFYFLLSGRDLGEYISGFWSMALVFFTPLIFPLVQIQRILFKALGEETTD
ncbi:MAG: hypothetical protein ACWGOV_09550 [Acidiferrobacterales bacterium]